MGLNTYLSLSTTENQRGRGARRDSVDRSVDRALWPCEGRASRQHQRGVSQRTKMRHHCVLDFPSQ